jgi:hypothetical protein
MVYLQDSDNASRLLELDKSSVRRLSAARSFLLRNTVARAVSGHFGYLEDKPAAIYLAGGRLWMAIDGKPWFLEELRAEVDQADDGLQVEITAPDHHYGFSVDSAEGDLDATALASAEDSSFGLWAAHIMNSPERQHVLRDVLIDAPIDRVPEHAKVDASPSPELKRSWLRQTRSSSSG